MGNPSRCKDAQPNTAEHYNQGGHQGPEVEDFKYINIIVVVEYPGNVDVEVKWEHNHCKDGTDSRHRNGKRKI